MSIHDVSKGDHQRLDPKPNASDIPTQSGDSQMPFNHTTGGSVLVRQVKTGAATVINDGSTVTTTTAPHHLGFRPTLTAAIENGTITNIGTNVNITLPTFLQATIDTVDGLVLFTVYLFAAVDDTNVYIQMLNSTGIPISITVTYYLFQQAAQ